VGLILDSFVATGEERLWQVAHQMLEDIQDCHPFSGTNPRGQRDLTIGAGTGFLDEVERIAI
jgi:hypothetical protein